MPCLFGDACVDCGVILTESNSHFIGLYMQRRCRECFYKRKKERDGRHNWKATESGKKSVRNSNLKARYGISLDEYNRLLELQNGLCAICENECMTGQELSVDHNHNSGVTRGLLCKKCNFVVGLINEDEGLIFKVLKYLRKYKELEVEDAS